MYIFKSGLDCADFIKSDSEYAKKYLDELNEEYEMLRDKPVRALSLSAFMEYFKSGNRLEYENEYFHRRTMLRDFALKAWLGDMDALKRLENVLEAVCSENTWALPAHIGNEPPETTLDLFAAETAQALSEIISLLKDRISQEISEKCVNEIKKRVLNPFINRAKPYGWESAKSNWCAVCGGCVGMTAIYLIEDDSELLKVTDGLKEALQSYLLSFSCDGACLEGLYYWNYGMMYFTAFLDLYKQRTGKDFPIDYEMAKNAADFARKCILGGGFTISFSDGYERDRVYSGLLCKLSEMYGSAPVESEYTALFYGDACGRWCKAVRDIAWTKETDAAEYEIGAVFKDAQWAILRGENICAVFKGGTNDEPHNHNDIGSVIVVKDNEMILCDIGAGEYTAEYFSEGRYNIFCNRSGGHSVPIIGGAEQKAGKEYRAEGFFADGNSAGADISGAYGYKPLKKCVRTLCCDGEKAKIQDTFELSEETEITERFITRHKAQKSDEGIKIISGGKTIGTLISDNASDVKIKTYPHRDHGGNITEITAIDFIFKAEDEYIFKLIVK
ncbi:MAG: heparinase II/III family protein [Oscillospiraceae bacterium]|nr:heparinase II/III family protein [Oscillospiraceae bacterium]